MTGPEHYKEAERLAELSRRYESEAAAIALAEAQVHATLAEAAAICDASIGRNLSAWSAATGPAKVVTK